MIIKGTSRGNPKQLAAHLLRTDTNEHVRILEMNSPVDDLEMTLRDWQLLTAATSGTNGLYHANISPDAGYAMTEEQWERAADVLAEKLGLSHQPRLVILHEKEGREHIHVVWQRTDTDTMTLVSDSWNYLAHEKASLALEEEFGHELVPGKHAKRDRDLQPDFPRAKINHEEWQQAERLGIDPLQFKETITALYHQSDTGQAFKKALEEHGLFLATGDKRNFVLVDGQGEVYSLSRQLLDVTAKDMKKFLKDEVFLPSVEFIRTIQDAHPIPKEQPPTKQPEPPKPEPKPPLPFKFLFPEQEKPEPKAEPAKDPQQEKLEAALKERNARENRELKYRQDMEMERLKQSHKVETDDLLEARKRVQQNELSRFYQRYEEHSDDWVKKFYDVIRNKWNPALAEQRRLEKQQRLDEIRTRHRIERETLIETGRLRRDTAIEELKHRHGQQIIEQNNRQNAELLRHHREQEHARQILKEMEEERRKAELAPKRDGPAPPKPSL
jgi:hypothetical protein